LRLYSLQAFAFVVEKCPHDFHSKFMLTDR
jgi:hypothetical protein